MKRMASPTVRIVLAARSSFHSEFFLDFHDNLNHFEGIGTEIVDKIGVIDNRAGICAKLVNDDF